ncbi:MAG: DUF1326 domain-containing protein [Gammaproteobacteria bacterium]|nr:DUF1326 domain-containing protein [Gammaproteobacteria bacterium]MDP2142160.1 DUF1326 domain-containing protein [Gammaproteobacteria bacterium]MDP2348232.1 DUF1326 domain-containing protein [Gammaproteobacteria bacterium]
MKRRVFTKGLLSALATAPVLGGVSSLVSAQGQRWSLVADLAECCSCEIPCPCNFGRPTELRCDGNRLIQIREGQFEGENLAGISFVVTFLMGNWTRIHIDDSMSDAQFATFEKMFPVAFAGFDRLARTKARVPLNIVRTDSTINFTVPESSVEMKLIPGLGGEPIVINGLPNPAYHEYVQYESVNHRHESTDATWTYSGTNGFTSVMRVSG